MLVGVGMKSADFTYQAIRLVSDIGLKSTSRRMRLAADVNRQVMKVAFSQELKDAMSKAGISPKLILGDYVLFMSDNTVPGQLPYRISLFDKETFTPLGHTYYSTPEGAVQHLKELEAQYLSDPFSMSDFAQTISADGTKVSHNVNAKETATKIVVALAEKDQHKLASRLQSVLNK